MKIDEIAILFLDWSNDLRLKRKRLSLMDVKDFLLDLADGDEEKANKFFEIWRKEKTN